MQHILARGALLTIGLALSTATVLTQDAPAATAPVGTAKPAASSDAAKKPAPATAPADASKKQAAKPAASSDAVKKPAPAPAPVDASKKQAAKPATSSDAAKKPAPAPAAVDATKKQTAPPAAAGQTAKKQATEKQPVEAAAPVSVEVDPKLAAQIAALTPKESPDAPLPPHGFTYKPDGRRDPFVTLVKRGGETKEVTAAARKAGLAGLASNEVTLRGVLATEGRYVALLLGADDKTYIVHPGDRLADGTIQTISADSMVILQRAADGATQKTREIHKRLRRTDATN